MSKIVRSCVYCGLTYGSTVHFKDGRTKILWEEVDHFWPRSLGKTEVDNTASCCNMCNGIKSDNVFETVDEVRSYIAPILEELIAHTDKHSPGMVRAVREVIREAKKQSNRVPILSPTQVNVPTNGEVLLNTVQGASVPEKKGGCKEVPGHAYVGPKGGPYVCSDCGASITSYSQLSPLILMS
jgi:hypothetical protein